MAALNNISAINNYVGMYFRAIIGSIYDKITLAEDAYVINDLTAKRQLWRYDAEDGMRPVDTDVEDTARIQGGFSVRSIEPRVWMKILKVIPEELRKTFLSEQLAAAAKEYPGGFSQYFWEEQAKRAAREINQNSYFGIDSEGVALFNAGTVYTAGQYVKFQLAANEGIEYFKCLSTTTAGQSPLTTPAKWKNANNQVLAKGWGTLIAEEIVATTITPTTLGSLTNANAFDKIDDEFYRSIPEEVRDNVDKITILCSGTTYEKRRQHILTKFPNSPEIMTKEGNVSGKIWGTNGRDEVKAVSWMRNSSRIIANIEVNGKKNLVMGVDRLPDTTSIDEMIRTLHGYKTVMKGILAYQIADPSKLYCSEAV